MIKAIHNEAWWRFRLSLDAPTPAGTKQAIRAAARFRAARQPDLDAALRAELWAEQARRGRDRR